MLPNYRLADAIRHRCTHDAVEALEQGADPSFCSDGKSMLQLAEKFHANDIARILIMYGASIDQRLTNGDSLLHAAVRNDNGGFAILLVDAGLAVTKTNDRGMTPLHIAAQSGNEYITRWLISAGADIHAIDDRKKSPLDYALQHQNLHLHRLLSSSTHASSWQDYVDQRTHQNQAAERQH